MIKPVDVFVAIVAAVIIGDALISFIELSLIERMQERYKARRKAERSAGKVSA